MAKKPTITQEDLKHDEVLEFADHLIFFLKTHGTKLLWGVAIGFAIYGVSVFMHQKDESRFASASNSYYQAAMKYDEALSSHQWATPEREQAMQEVISKADAIMEEFGDTEVARNAMFLKGNALYFSGDELGQTENTDRAIAVFQDYLTTAEEQGEPFEVGAALLALGYAHENLYILRQANDVEAAKAALNGAADYFNRVVDLKGSGFLKYEAMLALGRLENFNGNKEKAKEYFMTVLEETYRKVPDPEENASERDRIVYEVKRLANSFTSGSTALVKLREMGVDTDALLEEMDVPEAEL